MSFTICGQCQYFERETTPDDDEQFGLCLGFPPQIILFEGALHSMHPTVDAGNRTCALFHVEAR